MGGWNRVRWRFGVCGAGPQKSARLAAKRHIPPWPPGRPRGARRRERRAVPDAHAPARRQTRAKLRDAHGTLGRAGAGTSRRARRRGRGQAVRHAAERGGLLAAAGSCSHPTQPPSTQHRAERTACASSAEPRCSPSRRSSSPSARARPPSVPDAAILARRCPHAPHARRGLAAGAWRALRPGCALAVRRAAALATRAAQARMRQSTSAEDEMSS